MRCLVTQPIVTLSRQMLLHRKVLWSTGSMSVSTHYRVTFWTRYWWLNLGFNFTTYSTWWYRTKWFWNSPLWKNEGFDGTMLCNSRRRVLFEMAFQSWLLLGINNILKNEMLQSTNFDSKNLNKIYWAYLLFKYKNDAFFEIGQTSVLIYNHTLFKIHILHFSAMLRNKTNNHHCFRYHRISSPKDFELCCQYLSLMTVLVRNWNLWNSTAWVTQHCFCPARFW